jgi:retrograde regulation protein 2
MSKRRREQFPAIVTVVRALVEAVPYIKQVIFCSGGNREGVLYMKLSPDIRESSPLQVVPGGIKTDIPVNIVETIKTMVPSGSPRKDAISDNLLHYVAKNMYANMGDTDDVNSAKYLHSTLYGICLSYHI